MTGRERVRRALEFDRPDRVPRDLWTLPIAHIQHGEAAVDALRERFPSDFSSAGLDNSGLSRLVTGDPYAVGVFRDDWGCEFVNVQAGVIGEVKDPQLRNWSRLSKLRPPVEALKVDRETVRRQCAQTDRFVLAGCCPRSFERMQFLRGTEDLLMDIAEESPEFLQLRRIVHDFYCKELEAWSRTDVDGLMFMDDWGSQRSLLISPTQWRQYFKPLYADYVHIAHARGKKILMHSDGYIFDIYDDLIEIGVDAVNSQLFCMDIAQIGRQFRGKITFWGEIDRQHVLTHASTEEVVEAVKRVVDALYQPEGGVIAQFELGAGARMGNAHAVYAAWEQLTSQR